MDAIFHSAAGLFPEWVKRKVKIQLDYCGSTMSEEVWLGRAMVISILVFVSCVAIFIPFVEEISTVVFSLILALSLYHIATYLILYFKAETRAKAVERVLPNTLQLIAANLNSGMTPFQAVQGSSRAEFGVLKDELDRTIALTLSSVPFKDALLQMPTRIKSQILKNVVELIVEGMHSGSPLATLLIDISNDITVNLDMRKEILTRTRSYILFIGFIVILGGPLLASVSIHFIRSVTTVTNEIMVDIPEVATMGGISFGQMTLNADFLMNVTILNIAITAFIASWLLATISEGNDRYLVKYVLFLLPASEFMFFFFDYIIQNVFVI